MKSIYQYPTCRDYLRSVYLRAKEANKGLSLELYADRVGLGRSTLKMIVSGKRKLTLAQALVVARAHKLSQSETEYLQSLALKDRSKSSVEKNFYMKRTRRLKNKARVNSFPLSSRGVLADPYTLPILVYLTDFRDKANATFPLKPFELQEIASRFQIDTARIIKSIDLLVSLGVICQPEGQLEVHYVFDKLIQVMSQQHYLKSWLKESEGKIDSNFNDPLSFFHASTISIDEYAVPQMIQEIKGVLEKYIAHPVTDGKKTLIQGCVQLFPIIM